MLAARIFARLEKCLQIRLPLATLFQAPTIEGLAAAILALLHEAKRAGYLTGPALQAVSRDRDLPLSFAQQRLWFLDQLKPNSAIYNLSDALRLSGPLNIEALQEALTAMVARHEVLRTTFAVVDGVPVQVISRDRRTELRTCDLSRMSACERERQVQRLLQEEADRPFNLSTDLMLRASLLKLEPEEHILLLVMHHIASDGWSRGVLFRELAVLYEAFSNGKPSPLPALPIQYADFASWQRQWLQGEVLESQLSYWKQQLNGAPHLLELPTDRPRPAAQSYRGGQQSFLLSEALSGALKELSRQEGVTLFMTLLAAFKVLLHRYTGQDDIVVGSPIASRSRVETEGLIGFFVNDLVLRTDLSGDPTFREVLGGVRETALGAYAHQDLPFEKLVEELQPKRELAYHPLFQVVFALQNFPTQALRLSGLTMSPREIENDTAKFDLSLTVVERREGLRAGLEYSSDLFDEATIKRMATHFQRLVEGIVADPDQRLSKLPLLTPAERCQLLVEWNDTKKDYPHDRGIHQLFEAQVERSPGSVAVTLGDQELTYRELNARANQLAHYLKKHGVNPDVLVGLCVERSLEMVVGLLGILKAGGAYLPLDPDYPKERLAFMLEDARVSVLLTEQRFWKQLPGQEAQVICLDSDWQHIAQESNGSVHSGAGADSLAYVMYTSGSTGRPKGLEVCHRGVLRLLFGIDYVELDSRQSILQMAPISFDASTFELWGALLHGARCVLFPDRVPTVTTLGMALRKHRISILWLTASLYNMVIDEAPEILSGVRQLLIGGEALSLSHVRRGLDLLPSTQIINGYGPTESTTFTCCYRIPRRLAESVRSVPIGRPIGNTEVYLLDRDLQLVPIGVSGELFIGGAGLVRGYLNRPELTAEKFIPNPFSDASGARLYETGDLARYLPDGNIEFLGRLDHQVKIRGFRIELGEIEAVLGQHPNVRNTVVATWEPVPGHKQLIAYVVPLQESSPTPTELRGFLQEKIPDYLIPSAFLFLKSLPLTPNGKIDRRALPAPDRSKELTSTFTEPRNEVERQLVGIWEEVLAVNGIGTRDNFFDLGGHSLLAARIFARLEKCLQIRLPLATLFQAPTIEGLAAVIRNRTRSTSWRSLVAIQPAGNRSPIFAVPGVGGNVLGYNDLARLMGPEQPFYGLQSRGLDGTEKPHTSIEDIAAAFLKEIREVQ
ncbi:MAG: non-ribosomal peptide synthetase, partial [Acidobacteria bacterium]